MARAIVETHPGVLALAGQVAKEQGKKVTFVSLWGFQ
jgi:hypothetical protein